MSNYDTDNIGIFEVLVRSFNMYFIGAWKKAFDFQGRASRKQFWLFFLWNCVIVGFLLLLDYVLGFTITVEGKIYGVITNIYRLFLILPYLSLFIRRLHDIGFSGMWLIVIFLALIGCVWLSSIFESIFFVFIPFFIAFYFLVKKGEPYTNKYGAPPDY